MFVALFENTRVGGQYCLPRLGIRCRMRHRRSSGSSIGIGRPAWRPRPIRCRRACRPLSQRGCLPRASRCRRVVWRDKKFARDRRTAGGQSQRATRPQHHRRSETARKQGIQVPLFHARQRRHARCLTHGTARRLAFRLLWPLRWLEPLPGQRHLRAMPSEGVSIPHDSQTLLWNPSLDQPASRQSEAVSPC